MPTGVFHAPCWPRLPLKILRVESSGGNGSPQANSLSKLVRSARIERATDCLEGSCSIQLSYERNLFIFDWWPGLGKSANGLAMLVSPHPPAGQPNYGCRTHRPPERTSLRGKIRTPNRVRNASSGKYYARFRVHGKLVWRSLETVSFTVAKPKLSDVVKAEKQFVAAGDGQITLAQAVKIYLDRDERNPGLKEKTRQYHAAAAAIVGRLFPRGHTLKVRYRRATQPTEKFGDITSRDVRIREISKDDCLVWAATCAKRYSATLFNHTLGTFRQIIDIGIEQGARFDNPSARVSACPRSPRHSSCRSRNNSNSSSPPFRTAAAVGSSRVRQGSLAGL